MIQDKILSIRDGNRRHAPNNFPWPDECDLVEPGRSTKLIILVF